MCVCVCVCMCVCVCLCMCVTEEQLEVPEGHGFNTTCSLLTWFDPVEQGQRVVGGQSRHMQIVDGGYNI